MIHLKLNSDSKNFLIFCLKCGFFDHETTHCQNPPGKAIIKCEKNIRAEYMAGFETTDTSELGSAADSNQGVEDSDSFMDDRDTTFQIPKNQDAVVPSVRKGVTVEAVSGHKMNHSEVVTDIVKGKEVMTVNYAQNSNIGSYTDFSPLFLSPTPKRKA